MGRVGVVEMIGNKTTISGLLHHLIEQRLTPPPQALPEAAEDGGDSQVMRIYF